MGLLSPVGLLFVALAAGAALFAPELLDLAKALELGPVLSKLREALASIGFDLPGLDVIKEKILTFRDSLLNAFGGFGKKISDFIRVDVGGFVKLSAAILGVLIFMNPLLRVVRMLGSAAVFLFARFKVGAALAVAFGIAHKGLGKIVAALSAAFAALAWTYKSNTREGELMRAIVAAIKAAAVRLWDAIKQLGESLGELITQVDKALEPIGGLQGLMEGLAAVVGAVLGAALIAVITILENLVKQVTSTVDSLTKFVSWVNNELPKIPEKFGEMVDAVKGHLGRMVGALGKTGGAIGNLGESFKWLYDKVVGNSWIPDLVDGVIAHGRRLVRGFFTPVGNEVKTLGAEFKGLTDQTMPELEARIDKIGLAMDKLPVGSPAFKELNRQAQEINKTIFEATAQTEKLEMTAEEMRRGAFGALINRTTQFTDALIDGTNNWKDAFKSAVAGMASDIAKLIVQQQTLALFGSIGKAAQNSDNFLGALVGGVGSLLGFARGGRPTPGEPVKVGERGVETFVPDSAGTIFPHDFRGGGGNQGPRTVNYNEFHAGVSWRDMASIETRILQKALQGVPQQRSQGGNFRRST
jgi:uncharacterized protein YoxC